MLIEHPGPRKYLLGALESTPEIIEHLLQSLDDKEADFRPDSERFSIREVVAHLADWDEIFLARLRRARDEEEPFLPDIDEGQIALDHDYARSNWKEQLQVLAARRRHLCEFARSLEPHDWQRLAVHERAGRMTMEGLVTLIVLHDAYHVRQVVEWRRTFQQRGRSL